VPSKTFRQVRSIILSELGILHLPCKGETLVNRFIRLHLSLIALLILSCLGATARAQGAPAAAATRKFPAIKHVKYTLPNGLTVITHEDHRLPLVAVDLWYHVGR
jgi:hypothetical protein